MILMFFACSFSFLALFARGKILQTSRTRIKTRIEEEEEEENDKVEEEEKKRMIR